MRILVTGGAGFIVSHLVDYLISQNHEVLVLDNLSTGKRQNVHTSAEFINGDITDTELLTRIFNEVEFCYHLAAIPSVHDSIENWSACHKVNLGGTISIFEAATKVNAPVVYASSAAVYGAPQNLPIEENDACNPLSPYGLDKYCSEAHAKFFAKLKGLKSVGLRFFNVYGPRQDPASPYSGVISIFIDKILNNKYIEVFGDGEQQRDFIYVGDVVQALIKANNTSVLERASVVNVCTGHVTTINDLINILFEVINKKSEVKYLPARSGDICKSLGSACLAEKLLQFKATTTIAEGLRILLCSLLLGCEPLASLKQIYLDSTHIHTRTQISCYLTITSIDHLETELDML